MTYSIEDVIHANTLAFVPSSSLVTTTKKKRPALGIFHFLPPCPPFASHPLELAENV